MTTMSPLDMNFFIPPNASIADLVISEGKAPLATTRSVFSDASTVLKSGSKLCGTVSPIPLIAAIFRNSLRFIPPPGIMNSILD